jgi:predicted esterase
MRKIDSAVFALILVGAFFLATPRTVGAKEGVTVEFSQSPSVVEPAVTYVSRAPNIDGVLDGALIDLPVRRFTMVRKSSSENPDVAISYRLAYGAHYLYVYIEGEAETFAFRDRAYQNGDGFTVVLTVPKEDSAPTEEFYVLACSAVDRRPMEWTRKIFWYYNVDNIFLPTSNDMKMEFHDGDGIISFELLLPWKDVHPYHPWLSEGIGFNLGMAKAIGEEELNFYKVVDAGIGYENSPREYALLRFEEPRHEGDPQTYLLPNRNNISIGDTLIARAVTVAAESCEEDLRVLVESGEKTTLDYTVTSYYCEPGLTYRDVVVKSYGMPAGGYVLNWYSTRDASKGETGLTIMPEFYAAGLNRRVEKVKAVLSPGSYTTFQFMIEEIGSELDELYPYETGAPSRIKLLRLLGYIEDAEQGEDTFAARRDFVRMAYRSKLDDTLQPYVVYIPEDFDPSREYPLLVFLHGSASTEHNIIEMRQGIPDGFIALGPKGRGPSNYYSWDNAQTDVAEAIEAVKENLPIDDDAVILSGFSMGGYGVYRTFYETPGAFKGLAVFSGFPKTDTTNPDGEPLIDFTEPRHRGIFKRMPMFIFHGRRDRNVPFDQTERFVSQLREAGALVEFHPEDGKGHEPPSLETIAAFQKWAKKVVGE